MKVALKDTELDATMAVLAVAIVVILLAVALLTGCGGSEDRAKTVAKAAECAGLVATFDELQTQVIEGGFCDDAPTVQECFPHIALREGLVESLKAAECPPQL